MMSPLTVVKEDYFTALTPAGITRWLEVHHPSPGTVQVDRTADYTANLQVFCR
jgi:hypothetical protein